MTLSEHAERNREAWTALAPEYATSAERAWTQNEVTWGVWRVPDSGSTRCRTWPARTSSSGVRDGVPLRPWLPGRARVTGVDVTPAQLETARAMRVKFGP
jgi:hypothetical protein